MGSGSHHRAVLVVLAALLTLTLFRAQRDGRSPSIPSIDETIPVTNARASSTGAALSINECSAEELRRALRIGARLAQRIIDERARRGGFCSLSELDAIEGVGPVILRRLEERVVFDSQVHGPSRPCDHGHAVREPTVDQQRIVRSLHGQSEIPGREPVDAEARAAADGDGRR